MSASLDGRSLTLWSWPASDCSARLRIALSLKGIPYELRSVDLAKGDRPDTLINPAQTVPTLIITHNDIEQVRLTQSVAALEYLDEAFPESRPLLPDQAEARAQARTLAHVIATDIHPLTTPRVGKAIANKYFRESSLETKAQDAIREWDLYWMRRGLSIYEQLVANSAGIYSVGDTITVADVCLVPQVSTARKMGLDVTEFPIVQGIFDRLSEVQAFRDDVHATATLSS